MHVLPAKLATGGLDYEYALFIHALWMHAQLCWGQDVGQQQHLLSCLYRELGRSAEEEQALRNSFLLTRADDHEFVTKAQLVWQCLLDQNRPQAAREFLLEVNRFAPVAALGEIRELLELTLAPAPRA